MRLVRDLYVGLLSGARSVSQFSFSTRCRFPFRRRGRRGKRTSGSNPYFRSSPPDPYNPAHLISGFWSPSLVTPIALVVSHSQSRADQSHPLQYLQSHSPWWTTVESCLTTPLPSSSTIRSNDSLGIRKRLLPIPNIHSMLPIRRDQPLDLSSFPTGFSTEFLNRGFSSW